MAFPHMGEEVSSPLQIDPSLHEIDEPEISPIDLPFHFESNPTSSVDGEPVDPDISRLQGVWGQYDNSHPDFELKCPYGTASASENYSEARPEFITSPASGDFHFAVGGYNYHSFLGSPMPPINENTSRRHSTGNNANVSAARLRRRAQNRAAQRAFRDRKEQLAKDLEEKIQALEKGNARLYEENDKLKRRLAEMKKENEESTPAKSEETQSPTETDTVETVKDIDGKESTQGCPVSGSREDSGYSSDTVTSKPSTHRPLPQRSITESCVEETKLDPAKASGGESKHLTSCQLTLVSSQTGNVLLAVRATWGAEEDYRLVCKGLSDVLGICETLNSRKSAKRDCQEKEAKVEIPTASREDNSEQKGRRCGGDCGQGKDVAMEDAAG